ncbi:MAG: copper homeostasis protein CutC [Erysipelotrichales bacterium]|nr:copper homeostasis protein CutC [Erysipelotrichales bacterium]
MKNLVEVCCGSYADAVEAFKNNADRVELNSALHAGGLTPSLASLLLTKMHTNIKVITMIRPRGAGFIYSDEDFEVMKIDTKIMLENGADGIAFGCLDENGKINIEQCREIIKIVKYYDKEVVFHRAYDFLKDPYEGMEILINLGVDRVLTSGLQAKAYEGIELIRDLQARYGDKIEILAGGGVNASNAREIVEFTGINQVHSSCKSYVTDFTTIGDYISYSCLEAPHERDYDIVDGELVKALVECVK